MMYVQQSLTKGEEIVRMGHFHWMYTVSAVSWIVIGIALSIGILWGGVQVQLMSDLSSQFQNLPDNLVPQAKERIIESRGGLFQMVLGLHPGIKILAFVMFIFGLFSFARMMVIKATTEIAVTNKRMICKQGLIARHVTEMSVDRVEGVNVYQGILGRIFGYGSLIVRGMGVGEVHLPPIEQPIAFRQAIEKSKMV